MSEPQGRQGEPFARTLVTPADRVSLERAGAEALSSVDVQARYAPVSPLGEGGMGEVWLTRDTVIGRDVAMKSVRRLVENDLTARTRFLREARVQGQLSHPSIVPVYDLGAMQDGRLYFTMQRVRGRGLDELVDSGALTRYAALAAMSRVCLAVDFAHAHGVVHRDLKPPNLMLGDYGEVYVLDWGLAKLVGQTDVGPSGERRAQQDVDAPVTTVGSMLGTPGYMAPEQVRGEEVDERTDVYALGACLFELLARKPLHEGTTFQTVIKSTLAGADARVARRAPEADVPPELEEICVRATKTDPSERFATARAMYDAIERFLEGDRDLERRRARSREHADGAARLAKEALEKGSTAARADAMREVGRALALDASNKGAMHTLVALLTDPPRTTPPEVRAQIDADRDRGAMMARRYAAAAFLSTLAALPFALWMGVRSWPWLALVVGSALLGAGMSVLPRGFGWVEQRRYVIMAIGIAGLVATSRLAGVFLVVPVMAMGLGVGLALFPKPVSLGTVIAVAAAAIVVPLALEWVGVLLPAYEVGADRLCVRAQMVSFPAVPTLAYLLVVTLAPIAATCAYLVRMRDRLLEAEVRIRVQAWQLRNIVGDRPVEESGHRD